jgi:hypothetical protein
MRLYVAPMDATLLEVDADGRVRFENEDWKVPTLQERRAILYSAANELEELQEAIEILQKGSTAAGQN